MLARVQLNARSGAGLRGAASRVPGRVCLTAAAARRVASRVKRAGKLVPIPTMAMPCALAVPSARGPRSHAMHRRFIAASIACSAALALGRAEQLAHPPSPGQPEPHYWRQPVFFIPYQPNAQDPQASKIEKVQLLVSRDGGQQWAVLQEAEPNVRGLQLPRGERRRVRLCAANERPPRPTVARADRPAAAPRRRRYPAPHDATRGNARRHRPDHRRYEARDLKLKTQTLRLESANRRRRLAARRGWSAGR